MYGTVTRLQFQPAVDGLAVLQARNAAAPIAGLRFQYVYHLDATPNMLILVAGFESRDAYEAYAARNDDAATEAFRSLLAAAPEVHGGTISSTTPE